MLKKLLCFSFILLTLSITSTSMADVDIVAYYGMEEGSGDTVADPIGGYDGTTDGSPAWVDGPEGFGTALSFINATSGVECGTFEPVVDGKVSIAFWANFEGTDGEQYQGLIAKAQSSDSQEFMLEVFGESGNIYWNSTGTDDWNLTNLPAGKWTHIAIVHDNASGTTDIYANGAFQRTSNATWGADSTDAPIRIGSSWGDSNFFYGAVDEVYFFSSLLTADEVAAVMNGEYKPEGSASGLAKSPKPSNKKENVSIDVNKLSWKPGDYALEQNGTHNVFFGTDQNSVGNATVDNAEQLGVTLYEALAIDSNSISISRLEYDKTYYWRVDEVNNPASTGSFKGKTWSFQTEPEGILLESKNIIGVEGSAPDTTLDNDDPNVTYDGTGLVIDEVNDIITHSNELTDMWGGIGIDIGDVWLKYELDQIYKLHELEIWNFNAVEPSNAFGGYEVEVSYSIDNETWQTLDEVQLLNKASGLDTYSDYDVVDMNGVIAKYVKLTFLSSHNGPDLSAGGISEIRFLIIPTRASKPSPANNATDVEFDTLLSWDSGRGADLHKIYIGSEKSAVKNGTTETTYETTEPNYPITVGLGQTYYWRVDEINDAEEYPVWDGQVWKFSTLQYIVIDDFESDEYGDSDTNAVYVTWQDHYTTGESDNYSNMGREYGPPYLQTIRRNGDYSAPMSYYNSYGGYSQVIAYTEDLEIGAE